MITNSVLRLFLTLSIVIIVAGILVVVFVQFDRGYVFTGIDRDFQAEQHNLIKHEYLKVGTMQPTTSPSLSGLEKRDELVTGERGKNQETQSRAAGKSAAETSTPKSLPARPVPGPTASPAVADSWRPRATAQSDYYTRLLRNNPWSPDFKPGH